MSRSGLVRLEYPIGGRDQARAWAFALDLCSARGLPPPPTTYKARYLYVKVHPDDLLRLRAYCQALDFDAGRVPDFM